MIACASCNTEMTPLKNGVIFKGSGGYSRGDIWFCEKCGALAFIGGTPYYSKELEKEYESSSESIINFKGIKKRIFSMNSKDIVKLAYNIFKMEQPYDASSYEEFREFVSDIGDEMQRKGMW